ncbi:MAG TPA: type II secretion system F family protein [Vicinamibacterales bacterium]|nr:type II secretion system F family protein [Vicinamibacterales bacterium]
MEYRCRVATASGQIMEATYVSENEARLRLELEEKGLYLLSVQGGAGLKVGGLQLRLPRRRKIPSAEFIIFNQELATLLKAGLPLVQSLDILRKRVPNPTFKAALDDVYERVRSGSALSEAFEAQRLFTGVYTASLMAGEKSGSLEQVIRRYVQHVKVLAAIRGKVISALIYPAVLVLLSIAVVSLIVFKVVPEFAAFYSQEGTGAQLPLSTRIVVAISTTLVGNGGLIVAAIVGLVTVGVLWFRQPKARALLHAWVLKLPYFGPLARKFATAQVSRTLATLLSGGIPLVNSLDIAAKSVGNRHIADHLAVVAKQVREGGSLAGSLAERKIFPHVAVEMVEVGESTGALADMLNSVADFYDEENETSLTRFSNLIQPLLLIVMGVIIAGLLLSLYMPLFQLSSTRG